MVRFARRFRLWREFHSLLVGPDGEIVMILQVVNLPLTHQRKHSRIEVELLQLLRRSGRAFSEFPDKERVELTKERDVTELYVGNKGYEITFKGVHTMEKKDLEVTCAAAASRSTSFFATG